MNRKSDSHFSGLIPPQAVEAEEAVLGACMLSGNLDSIIDLLQPKHFYLQQNGLIYEAIMGLQTEKKPIDIITVTNKLKSMSKLDTVGGAYVVTSLVNKVSSDAHVETHARVIVEKYLYRELIRISSEATKNSFNESVDVFELFDEVTKDLSDTMLFINEQTPDKPLAVSIDERVEQKKDLIEAGVNFTGIPTGNTKLDEYTGGWQKGNLIILAARPSMGKSVKAMDFVKKAAQTAQENEVVIFFSLEMSTEELIDRMIVADAHIDFTKYKSNKLSPNEIISMSNSAKKLKALPILIIDRAGINPKFIRKKLRGLEKRGKKVRLATVDYLQLMHADEKTNNMEQELGYISRSLKAIAKDFEFPFVALAQLSRAVETTSDKRPMLSHIRSSGQIEQDADIVMFIYRPSYYFEYGKHPDEDYAPANITEQAYKRAAELIIAKNRNGMPSIRISEFFVGEFQFFNEHAYVEPPEREFSGFYGQEDGSEDLPF